MLVHRRRSGLDWLAEARQAAAHAPATNAKSRERPAPRPQPWPRRLGWQRPRDERYEAINQALMWSDVIERKKRWHRVDWNLSKAKESR